MYGRIRFTGIFVLDIGRLFSPLVYTDEYGKVCNVDSLFGPLSFGDYFRFILSIFRDAFFRGGTMIALSHTRHRRIGALLLLANRGIVISFFWLGDVGSCVF